MVQGVSGQAKLHSKTVSQTFQRDGEGRRMGQQEDRREGGREGKKEGGREGKRED